MSMYYHQVHYVVWLKISIGEILLENIEQLCENIG